MPHTPVPNYWVSISNLQSRMWPRWSEVVGPSKMFLPIPIGIIEMWSCITQNWFVNKIWQFNSKVNWGMDIKLHAKFSTNKTSNNVIFSLNATRPFLVEVVVVLFSNITSIGIASFTLCKNAKSPVMWFEAPLSNSHVPRELTTSELDLPPDLELWSFYQNDPQLWTAFQQYEGLLHDSGYDSCCS